MRSITIQPWQSAMTRWGDAIFAVALLLTDNRKAAEQLTVKIFGRHSLADPAVLETRLYTAVIDEHRRRRLRVQQRLRRVARRHLLPQPLVQLAPLDRVLLALWLLRGVDGVRLATYSGLSVSTVALRLASALAALSGRPPDDDDAAAFNVWVARQLQPETRRSGSSDEYHVSKPQEATWQNRLTLARVMLRTVVGHQRLPLACVDAVEAELLAQRDGPEHWWHRPGVLIGGLVGMVGLALLLLVAPWQSAAAPTASREPTSREIVQQALDAWLAEPSAGVLHRRVWAHAPLGSSDVPLVTDVWLAAGSARHRVEVHRGGTLVEWQIADGDNRFEYASAPLYSSCRWGVPDALDRFAREYTLTVERQRQVRTTRLTLGAYGVGYHILEQAAAADDLSSFGARRVGEQPMLTLGFTDSSSRHPRKLILWIAPDTHQLHLVQELASVGGRSASRDLWRLESRDDLAGVSLARPEWPHSTVSRDVLLDPACPGLDANHVLSLRALNSGAFWWGQNYLPAVLPVGTSGALLAATPLAAQTRSSGNITAVFVGPRRWLTLTSLPRTAADAFDAADESEWLLSFDQVEGNIAGTACRLRADKICFPHLRFETRGWTEADVREVLATLKPVDLYDWLKHNPAFLEPAPLPPTVQDLFARALEAQRPRGEGPLHTVAEWSGRSNPARIATGDPYSLAPQLIEPERLVQEQWIDFAETEAVRYKELWTLPDGTWYSALATDGSLISEYNLREGIARSHPAGDGWWFAPEAVGIELMRHFLESTQPVTARELDGAILLEQPLQDTDDGNASSFAGPLAPWVGDLPSGTVVRRLWLDNVTLLPLRAESVHLAAGARETLLSSVVVSQMRYLDAPLPDAEYTLSQLPADTIRLDAPSGRAGGAGTATIFEPMRRALMWPEGTGVTLIHDQSPENLGGEALSASDPRLHRALYTPIEHLDMLDVIKVTTYQVASDGILLTMRQGPRSLLRHTLRQSLLSPPTGAEPREASVRVAVLVAGQQRDGWLIDHGSFTAFVVEVDEVLLHISGASYEYLQHRLLALVTQLEWIELGP